MEATEEETAIRAASKEVSPKFQTLINSDDLESLKQMQHLSFFEALRIELRGEVEVTVVTPGLTESELTKGKFMSKEGKMVLDQDLRDVQVNLLPVQPVERCARAIVESACRGDKNLAVPSWMKQTVVWKTFFPELLDWLNRLLVLTSPGTPATAAAGKIILDFTGAKKILYPCSIPSPDLEVD